MLSIIRKVFSFGSWSASHPGEPHPGDMLDAQFDEIIEQFDGWDQRVSAAIRADGKVAAGAVVASSLDPALTDSLAAALLDAVAVPIRDAQATAATSFELLGEVVTARDQAASAAALATGSAEVVVDARGRALERTRQLTAELDNLAAEIRGLHAEIKGIEADFNNATPVAEDWARASWMWAEWMDDTGLGGDNSLPDNAVKIMDLTGDHWSARWWANYAARAVQQKLLVQGQVSRYLYYASAGQTIYTGLDYYGQQLTVDWTCNAVQVFVGGLLKIPVRDYNAASQPPNQLILVTAPALGTPVELIVTAPFSGSAGPSFVVKRLDTSSWTFTGSGRTFALVNAADGTPISLGGQKESQLFVSINGVWQAAVRDYTVALTDITFVTAPESDAIAFGVVFDD